LFKNTLFLKIILIFTLPALGILYFSSVLVYEKIQSFYIEFIKSYLKENNKNFNIIKDKNFDREKNEFLLEK